MYQLSLFAAPRPKFCVRSTKGEELYSTFVEAANRAKQLTQQRIVATVKPWTKN